MESDGAASCPRVLRRPPAQRQHGIGRYRRPRSTSRADAVSNSVAGVDLTHVPYRGTTPAVTDLIGDAGLFDDHADSLPQIRPDACAARRTTLEPYDSRRSATSVLARASDRASGRQDSRRPKTVLRRKSCAVRSPCWQRIMIMNGGAGCLSEPSSPARIAISWRRRCMHARRSVVPTSRFKAGSRRRRCRRDAEPVEDRCPRRCAREARHARWCARLGQPDLRPCVTAPTSTARHARSRARRLVSADPDVTQDERQGVSLHREPTARYDAWRPATRPSVTAEAMRVELPGAARPPGPRVIDAIRTTAWASAKVEMWPAGGHRWCACWMPPSTRRRSWRWTSF